MKTPQQSSPADAIPAGDREHGEGNYEAGKRYNEKTKQFVDSGKVDAAARAAKPGSQGEQAEMDAAEDEGKSHKVGIGKER